MRAITSVLALFSIVSLAGCAHVSQEEREGQIAVAKYRYTTPDPDTCGPVELNVLADPPFCFHTCWNLQGTVKGPWRAPCP
jgi:hypothetical protein